MTMRHGEHSATVDPGVRGVIPSFSHRSLRPHSSPATAATPSAAFLPSPLLPLPPFPLLSTTASFDLCLRLSRLATTIATTTRDSPPLYLSPLSLCSSGKRRAAMYLPGGTTYVNLSHYILPGWANLNFPLSARDDVRYGENRRCC